MYVCVDEDGATVVPAPELAEATTYDACDAVREREPNDSDVHVIASGPTDENRVRYACLLHKGRDQEGMAGRGGSGTVLGAKNVKPVAVREGSFEPDVTDGEALRELTVDRMQPLFEGTEIPQGYGTSGLVNPINEIGKLGRRNNQSEHGDQTDADRISGETLKAEHVTEDTTCANCAVRCGKHVTLESEDLTDAKIPEFESLFATLTMQEVYDIKRVMKANDLCDRLSMDTISWGVTAAFGWECYERGLVDTDASPHLEFGDGDGLGELARPTAERHGFGDALAEGVLSARTSDRRCGGSLSSRSKEIGVRRPFAARTQRYEHRVHDRYSRRIPPRHATHAPVRREPRRDGGRDGRLRHAITGLLRPR